MSLTIIIGAFCVFDIDRLEVHAESELLYNSDFAEIGNNGLPKDWAEYAVDKGSKGLITVLPGEGIDGSNAVKISPQDGTRYALRSAREYTHYAQVTPDTSYVLSYKIKGLSAAISVYSTIRQVKNRFGENGTHHFIIDDFMRAYETGKLSPTNIWQVARFNIPGLMAQQSALNNGQTLDVVDLGEPPADWEVS